MKNIYVCHLNNTEKLFHLYTASLKHDSCALLRLLRVASEMKSVAETHCGCHGVPPRAVSPSDVWAARNCSLVPACRSLPCVASSVQVEMTVDRKPLIGPITMSSFAHA